MLLYGVSILMHITIIYFKLCERSLLKYTLGVTVNIYFYISERTTYFLMKILLYFYYQTGENVHPSLKSAPSHLTLFLEKEKFQLWNFGGHQMNIRKLYTRLAPRLGNSALTMYL